MGDKTKWETTTTTTIIDDQICRRLRPAYKNDPLTNIYTYIFLLDQFLMQFLKFLTEKVKSKLFCIRNECRVTVKILKIAGKMV